MGTIYHGTTEALAIEALTTGIAPRTDLGELVVPVSLGYAPLLSSGAGENDEKWAIIEINDAVLGVVTPPNMPLATYLDEDLLVTGDNPLGLGPPDLIDESEEDRMIYFNTNIAAYGSLWSACLADMGSWGYLGTIPVGAITKIVIFDPTMNKVIKKAAEAQTMTAASYSELADTVAFLTSWFFSPPTPLTMAEFVGPLAEPQLTAIDKSTMGEMTAALRDYSALTVLYP